MHDCIFKLLRAGDEESLESMCMLLFTIGKDLDSDKAKVSYFDVLVFQLIIYKEMFLGCDWLIRVQLIPNITQNSAKICNTVQKSVTTVQKSVTTSELYIYGRLTPAQKV